MTFIECTNLFELWLEENLAGLGGLDRDALAKKHAKMRGLDSDMQQIQGEMERNQFAAHTFLRATFYRWAEQWKDMDKGIPEVLSVGDIHVENFGTWSIGGPDLVWGVNDADEACRLPWTSDLVRLGVSLKFSITTAISAVAPLEVALREVISGYQQGLAVEPPPRGITVTPVHPLFGMVKKHVLEKKSERFWEKKFKAIEPAKDMPQSAGEALTRSLPEGAEEVKFWQPNPAEPPGTGSLGKRRFFASAVVDGTQTMREAKPVVDSALVWATDGVAPSCTELLLASSYRIPDPTQQLDGGWIVRGIAPNARKLSFQDLLEEGTKLEEWKSLFHFMGAELAGLHRSGGDESLRIAILADMARREPEVDWFQSLVGQQSALVEDDQKEFSLAVPPLPL